MKQKYRTSILGFQKRTETALFRNWLGINYSAFLFTQYYGEFVMHHGHGMTLTKGKLSF